MITKKFSIPLVAIVLAACFCTGCGSAPVETQIPVTPTVPTSTPRLPTATAQAQVSTNTVTVIIPSPPPASVLADTAFPAAIDVTKPYLFYLHGKIIEDQGIPAISADFGEYEYEAILEKLQSYGFVVISEQRAKNTDGVEYANRVADQVNALLEAGVPAKNITVVGASKGAWIATYVSHFLQNSELNFVLLAVCEPGTVGEFIRDQVFLYGNVLSIYDSSDDLSGSCQKLFDYSQGRGLTRYHEIVLEVGTGHGILYQPLDEWLIPAVEWAGRP